MKRIDGVLKDTLATWRALTLPQPSASSKLQVALIAATSHDQSRLQQNEALSAIQSFISITADSAADSRQKTAATAAEYCARLLLTERLQKTKSWTVALKCLILFHNALINHGSFDSLLFHLHPDLLHIPNLTNFKDCSSALSLEASFWIRWYSLSLDTLLGVCNALGGGAATASFRSYSPAPPSPYPSHLPQHQLHKILHALHAFLHQICACPLPSASSHPLIRESFKLVALHSLVAQDLLRLHLRELISRTKAQTSHEPSASDAYEISTEFLTICNELATDVVTLANILQLARSMNLLFLHPDPERAMLKESEVRKFREDLSAISTEFLTRSREAGAGEPPLMLRAPPKVGGATVE